MNAKNCFIGGLVLFSAGLFAEDMQSVSEFDKIDASGDGVISETEAQGNSGLLKKWADVDKNADGVLDVSEFSAFESQEVYIPKEDDDKPDLGAAPTEAD